MHRLELAAAYHQRWEEESAIGEVKPTYAGGVRCSGSQSPAMVEQQMWGLLLAHYATRALLVEAVDEARYDPDRTSLYAACGWSAARSPTRRPFPPDHLAEALVGSKQEILRHTNPERRHRTCPWVVKRARNNSYRVKRPTDKIIRHAGPPTPLLACPKSLP